jgi:PBP1b-binding outer membrane lipoprotein LpoB
MLRTKSKRNMNRTRVLVVAGWAMALAGCAAAPIQEMSDARQAIEAAVQSGGDQKAAEQMHDARAAMAQAERALKNVQYRRARELAEQARAKAIEAQHASD